MDSIVVPTKIPSYDGFYTEEIDRPMRYVYHIKRDRLATDLFKKLTEKN